MDDDVDGDVIIIILAHAFVHLYVNLLHSFKLRDARASSFILCTRTAYMYTSLHLSWDIWMSMHDVCRCAYISVFVYACVCVCVEVHLTCVYMDVGMYVCA